MLRIDLNCDMGESFGTYRKGLDEEVIKFVSSANIACGWHAGDPHVMNRTVQMAAAHGVGVGAHPGYPDLEGFGRRALDCTRDEIRNYVIYQIGALQAFCAAHRAKMRHVKPHGSLYNAASEDPAVAEAIAEGIASVNPDLIFVGLAGPKGAHIKAIGARFGLKVALEAFADRAYTPDGNLVSRKLPGAVLTDPALVADRAVGMAKESKVVAVDGTVIDLNVQTICVHGDTPGAVEMVKRIRGILDREGVVVRPMEPAPKE
ncbi:MAG: LamB/YcsF family protein [Desulfomonile sp.]|nr:LamB/YcsF family protein [Desulfomonile sp.]